MDKRKIQKIIKIFKAKEANVKMEIARNMSDINGRLQSIEEIKKYSEELSLENDTEVSFFLISNMYNLKNKISSTISKEMHIIDAIKMENAKKIKSLNKYRDKVKVLDEMLNEKLDEEEILINRKEEEEILRLFNLIKSVKKN